MEKEPQSEAVVSTLEAQVTNLANSTGEFMERAALTEDRDASAALAAAIVNEVDALVNANGMATTVEAAREETTTWTSGFGAGALHGVREVTLAYLAALNEGDDVANQDDRGDVGRRCDIVGTSLAALQFGTALRLLASWSPTDRDEPPGSVGYLEGVQYALDRAIGSLRVRLEQRVLRLQEKDEQSVDDRRLSALLFIALTEPSVYRVLDSLGPEFAGVVDGLDSDNFVSCIDESTSRPLRVTREGAGEALRLVRRSEVLAA